MKPLFPPWSNTVFRIGLGALASALVGIPALAMIAVRTPYATGEDEAVDQPVEFDHRHHARDDGVACLYCHSGADHAPYAGVPPTALCMGCHGQIWPESERLAPVRKSYFQDEPIRWARVHKLPDFVYFHHGAHVSRGVPCASCHGRVDLMARVYQVRPLTMAWCLDCHRAPLAKVPGVAPDVAPPMDCTGCHR